MQDKSKSRNSEPR